MADEQFYVASRVPGQAYAAMVADSDAGDIESFYREHAGANVMKVGRDEMERMLRAYVRERRNDVESKGDGQS